MNNELIMSNKFMDQPCSKSALCEELKGEKDDMGCDETCCPNNFEDFFNSDLETFVTSEYEGDFSVNVTNADIEYESVEFINIGQGYEGYEEDCCLVAPHDTLKSDLESFVVHEDSFFEKVNDAFSPYRGPIVQNVDQESMTMSIGNISEFEWFSNVDCSDVDICKLFAMLDGPTYERTSFDIYDKFVLCLQEYFNDEYVVEVQTKEETNFHDTSCRIEYEMFHFLFQLDGAIMKLDECCFWHIHISNIEYGYCLFQAMPGDKVQISEECAEIKGFYDMLKDEELANYEQVYGNDILRLFIMQCDHNYIFHRGKH